MIDPVPKITCPACFNASDAVAWRESPITGELPPNHYQCPCCSYAFARERNPDPIDAIHRPIRCVPIPAVF